MMKRFVAGAAGILLVASGLMAGAGSASASAPKPVVSVSHFGGDTLTVSAVAGPKNSTISVTLKLEVTADQAGDPWAVTAFRTEIDPVLGAQACACGLFPTPPVFKGKRGIQTFKETSVVERSIGSNGLFLVNGFNVSVTDTKTGLVSDWVTISVPLRR
jgi:hypothetical protein